MEKGILTEELEELAIIGLDAAYQGNAVTEPVSDIAFKTFIPIIDNQVIENVVGEKITAAIREAGQLVYDKNYEGAAERISKAIEELTKFEESDTLKKAYVTQLKAIVLWVQVGLEKRKAA